MLPNEKTDESYAAALKAAFDAASPVIFVDVFDTLVERSIRPEHSKILACDRLAQIAGLSGEIGGLDLYRLRQEIERDLCRKARDRIGEVEFRLADMAASLHAALTARGLIHAQWNAEAFGELVRRAELIAERQVLRAKPGAIAALKGAGEAGKTVVIVSDFYIPASDLADLLDHVGISRDLYQGLHVSCDREASKRSGRMFDVLLKELGIPAADVTMIGDNPHSDIAMARHRGLAACQVEDAARVAFYASPAAAIDAPDRLREAIAAQVSAPDAPEAHLRQVVPGLILFAERLYRHARARSLQHLFFLSREGQILREIFEIYQDGLGVSGTERIATHYFLASRRSCFIASLAPLPQETFDTIFRQYRRISLRDFVYSLGLADGLVDGIASAIGASADTVADDLPTSPVFSRFCAHPDFIEAYEARRLAQNAALRAYVASFGVDLTRHPLALVDCGWKGSIQDYIAAALPEVQVEGAYLGLLSVGQPVKAKTGLLFSNNKGLTRDFVVFAENTSVFEVLLCADHGTVTEYRQRPDGSIDPVLSDDPVEQAFVRTHAMPVARDAVKAFAELMALRRQIVVSRKTLRDMAAEAHAALVYRPWIASARWLKSAVHRESFGQFNLSKVAVDRAVSVQDRFRFFLRLLSQPRRTLLGAFWPAQTVFSHGGKWAVALYALGRRLGMGRNRAWIEEP